MDDPRIPPPPAPIPGPWPLPPPQEPDSEYATPRVSPYRLAAHLVSAFAIYATLTWTTLGAVQGAMHASIMQRTQSGWALSTLCPCVHVMHVHAAFIEGTSLA